MKKLLLLAGVFGLIVLVVLLVSSKERDYILTYEYDGYTITEAYDLYRYTFNVKKDDIDIDFAYDHKYTTKRKLVKELSCNKDEQEYNICTIKVFDIQKQVRIKDKKLYSISYGYNSELNNEVLDTIDNIKIYDKTFTPFVWNSHGFKDVIRNKEYNFIDKEQYDNPLTYQYNQYLLIPDYNQSRTFNIFYIIDTKKQKLEKWKISQKISFDSYFLGDKDGLIYLFDKETKKEYSISIDKRKILKVSNNNGGFIYNGKLMNYSLDDLKYKDLSFDNNEIINYHIKDNKLYYNYYGSKKDIELLDDFKSEKIMGVDHELDWVFVLSGDTIYYSNSSGNYRKLASYFEWNFSTNNKVFLFNY